MEIEAPGKRIKYLRETMGLSQGELAERVGMNRTSLSKVELGLYEPSMAQLAGLAAALKTNVHLLVTGDELTPPELEAFYTPEANEIGLLVDSMDENLRQVVLHLARGLAQENESRRLIEKEYGEVLANVATRLESKNASRAKLILSKIDRRKA